MRSQRLALSQLSDENNRSKPIKYLIITVSIISAYKSQVLHTLNHLIPNSVFLDNIGPNPQVLINNIKNEFSKNTIDCLLIRKNNQNGKQRRMIKSVVDELNGNEMYQVKMICIDFIGRIDVYNKQFMNGVFTRIMMRSDNEGDVTPMKMCSNKICKIVKHFCKEYQSLFETGQSSRGYFDKIIKLDYTKPNLFLFVRYIIDEITLKYPDFKKATITDKQILDLTWSSDENIKKVEEQIKKFGCIDMDQYVEEYGNVMTIPDWLQERLDSVQLEMKNRSKSENKKKKKLYVIYYVGIDFNGMSEIWKQVQLQTNQRIKFITSQEFSSIDYISLKEKNHKDIALIITQPFNKSQQLDHIETWKGLTSYEIIKIGINIFPSDRSTRDEYLKSVLRYQMRSQGVDSIEVGFEIVKFIFGQYLDLNKMIDSGPELLDIYENNEISSFECFDLVKLFSKFLKRLDEVIFTDLE